MYQYEGIALPLGDQPGTDDGLTDTRGCDEDTGVMFAQGVNGLLLDGREFAIEPYVEWLARMALIIMVSVLPYCSSKVVSASWHPRGKARCLEKSSAQLITRGVNAVDNRMLCFL